MREGEVVAERFRQGRQVTDAEDHESEIAHTRNGSRPVDVVLARDWNGMNSGFTFYRRSAYTLELLRRMWRVEAHVAAPYWDQGALLHMMTSSFRRRQSRLPAAVRKDRAHLWVLERAKYHLNSYPVGLGVADKAVAYRPGDFIVHFASWRYHAACPAWIAALFQESLCSNAAKRPANAPVARASARDTGAIHNPFRALHHDDEGTSTTTTLPAPAPYVLPLSFAAVASQPNSLLDAAAFDDGDRSLDVALHGAGYGAVPFTYMAQ
jgi:hypothetical protein